MKPFQAQEREYWPFGSDQHALREMLGDKIVREVASNSQQFFKESPLQAVRDLMKIETTDPNAKTYLMLK